MLILSKMGLWSKYYNCYKYIIMLDKTINFIMHMENILGKNIENQCKHNYLNSHNNKLCLKINDVNMMRIILIRIM